MPNRKLTVKERFDTKYDIEEETGCWLWNSSKHKFGYGLLRVGPSEKEKKTKTAHRLSWEIYKGEIPEGAQILHRCDVPACVNPEHLFLGTQQDNMQDMYEKKRNGYQGSPGERNPKAKLTEAKVREIKHLLKAGKDLQTIADTYGVTHGAVWFIQKGLTWKNVKCE